MSDTQTKAAALVAEKIQNMRGRIQEAGDDDASKFGIYDGYNLFFDGLRQGMEIAGAQPGEVKPVEAAQNVISTRMAALEAEAVLAESIGQG